MPNIIGDDSSCPIVAQWKTVGHDGTRWDTHTRVLFFEFNGF